MILLTLCAGQFLIAALCSSFLSGVEQNPAVPASVKPKASAELSGGIPFLSDNELEAALGEARVPRRATDAILAAGCGRGSASRCDQLTTSLDARVRFSGRLMRLDQED